MSALESGTREFDSEVDERHADECGNGGPVLWVRVVAFWQKVGGADVEKEAGEKRDEDTQTLFRYREKNCDENAEQGGECINGEPT